MSTNKMHSEKFTIQWDDFQSNFSKEVAELFNDVDFTDVILATADNKQLKAHNVILNSSSLFFKNIFKNNSHKDSLIYLNGINFNNLESKAFIYKKTVQGYKLNCS